MKTTRQQSKSQGYILLTVLVIAMILSTLGAIGAQVLMNNSRFSTFQWRQSQALNVAEAGINYYLWHLAHNPTDYQDGTGAPATSPYGPYVHDYTDSDGTVIGTYTLTITPPPSGSTITTVRSIGQVPHLAATRTILAQLGQPSFANYALLSNAEVWFGATETANGPVQSNVGVHFDGVNNGPVTAGQATYKTDGVHGAASGSTHPGVWGNGGPTSQWQYPVPVVSFASISANLSTLATQAQSGGVYLNASGSKGYYLNLKSDGTIDIYKVTNEAFSGSRATGFTKTFVRNQAAPANGVFDVNDNVWISGTNWPGRITIVAATLPANAGTNRSIDITDNLTYAAKDGSAAIGLIAQKDVQISDYAPNNLEVDAATLAQNGSVFVSQNAPVKTAMTFYGSIANFSLWTWGWVDGGGTTVAGYDTTATNFDSHLIYSPPPQYPTTGTYSILNWREQLYNP